MMGKWNVRQCLRAIEAKAGSRAKLACELNVSEDQISYWHKKNSIPSEHIQALRIYSDGKFSLDELLGAYNDDSNK